MLLLLNGNWRVVAALQNDNFQTFIVSGLRISKDE